MSELARVRDVRARADLKALGDEMHALVAELFPICRSITGDGVRETLRRVGRRLPQLEVREVPTGEAVFDWTVPREWNVREAWIADAAGQRVVDFRASNLHLVSYSVPVNLRLTLDQLRTHLHSLPERPDWVPYRTSYYREDWGFCLSHRALQALGEGTYQVRVDATLADGHLSYGECLLPGETEDEVLVSTHVCHPSLANDNLSGIAVATWLASLLAGARRRYSYRFLFLPGTIGSIVWLARNQDRVGRIRHGLVAAGLGGPGRFHYKRTRKGDAEIDRAVAHVLRHSGEEHEVLDFVPFGYDERQYGSPGFDLPVGSLTRAPHGTYPEYHTSADDLGFVRPAELAGSLAIYLDVVAALEGNRRYLNLNPRCEPQLGRRGLYRQVGGGQEGRERELALLWVLNLSDGRHSLLDVAARAGMEMGAVERAAEDLLGAGLLRESRPGEEA